MHSAPSGPAGQAVSAAPGPAYWPTASVAGAWELEGMGLCELGPPAATSSQGLPLWAESPVPRGSSTISPTLWLSRLLLCPERLSSAHPPTLELCGVPPTSLAAWPLAASEPSVHLGAHCQLTPFSVGTLSWGDLNPSHVLLTKGMVMSPKCTSPTAIPRLNFPPVNMPCLK